MILDRFEVSTPFTNISVPVALEVINRKFMEYIDERGTEHFLKKKKNFFIPNDKVMSLLELAINSSFFCYQGRFYKQLQGTAVGSPVSPVIANIHMEYFTELALGPEYPITSQWQKCYVDGVYHSNEKPSRHFLQLSELN